MKYGHVRGKGGRNGLVTRLAKLDPSSPRITVTAPSELTEEVSRDGIKPEVVWARARLHLNIA